MPKTKNTEKQYTQQFHIYDFLTKCNIKRNQHDLLMKTFQNKGMKTIEEWTKLTGLKQIQ